MTEKPLTIINKLGLHARAAAKFVTTASHYSCSIQVTKDGKTVDGKSIMGIMMLAASQNSELLITADGEGETEAISALEALIQDRFGEDE